jgi:hypothetical protein
VLVPVNDEAAFTAQLLTLLTQPTRLSRMRRAAQNGAATLHERLKAHPSVRGAVDEFEAILHVAMSQRAVSEAAEVGALWERHLRSTRGAMGVAASVILALLLLLRIPAEASALDEALNGAAVAEARSISSRVCSIAIAAIPGALSFGVPLAASVSLRVPLRLTRWPPSRMRPFAVGALCFSLAFTVFATHTLHDCLASTDGALSLCAHSLFAWSRNPINVSTLLVAGYAPPEASHAPTPPTGLEAAHAPTPPTAHPPSRDSP